MMNSAPAVLLSATRPNARLRHVEPWPCAVGGTGRAKGAFSAPPGKRCWSPRRAGAWVGVWGGIGLRGEAASRRVGRRVPGTDVATCPGILRWLGLVGCIVATWLSMGAARLNAHDPGISTAEVEIAQGRFQITTGFAPDDAKQLLPAPMRTDERWEQDTFQDVRPHLLLVAPRLWQVRVGESVVAPREVSVELLPQDNVSFRLIYPALPADGLLVLQAPKLGELPSGHRQFVIVADEQGSTIAKKLLKASDDVIEVPRLVASGPPGAAQGEEAIPRRAAGATSSAPTFWGFLKLGVEHIWTGYDHLLFLFALLVVCRSFRSIVTIVSCFTLAHSLTLALATLEWVNLPARLVEPAIAASILYVGLENLWRRGEEPRGRWALTFAFGLIHGFGFASVLRDLGVGRASGSGLGLPLLSFNLGVELGQVVIAAAAMPLIWFLRRRDGFVRRGVPLLSALVALAGLYWLLRRTVWP